MSNAETRRIQCEQIAVDAGALLRSRFGDPGEVRTKGSTTLAYDVVTEVDELVEQLVLSQIAEVSPNSLVLAEEGGVTCTDGSLVRNSQSLSEGEVWLVDPLDGTINFAHGIPHFACSIACYQKGAPVAGAIFDPMVGELFSFQRNEDGQANAYHDQKIITMIDPSGAANSLVYIGSSVRHFPDVIRSFRGTRQLASAALALAWTGVGRTGAYVQLGGLNAWDWAVGAPFVQAAGGVVTDQDCVLWPAPLDQTTGIIAAAPSVHADIKRTLNR